MRKLIVLLVFPVVAWAQVSAFNQASFDGASKYVYVEFVADSVGGGNDTSFYSPTFTFSEYDGEFDSDSLYYAYKLDETGTKGIDVYLQTLHGTEWRSITQFGDSLASSTLATGSIYLGASRPGKGYRLYFDVVSETDAITDGWLEIWALKPER